MIFQLFVNLCSNDLFAVNTLASKCNESLVQSRVTLLDPSLCHSAILPFAKLFH